MARKNFEGLRMHDRTQMVQKAGNELTIAFLALCDKYELTAAERIKLLSAEMQTIAMYAIRQERHPDDPDKRGDEA